MGKSDFKCDVNFDPKLRRKVEIIDILLALVLVVLSIVSLLSYNFFKGQISGQVLLYGKIGLFFSAVFLELVPNFLNPYLPLIISLPILGVFYSTLLIMLGSLFGSILGFEIGRKYGFRFVCPLFQENTLKKILVFWSKHGKWFVSLGALTPLPYIPIIFGAFGMDRRDFWIYGILVRTISFIVVGYGVYYGFFNF